MVGRFQPPRRNLGLREDGMVGIPSRAKRDPGPDGPDCTKGFLTQRLAGVAATPSVHNITYRSGISGHFRTSFSRRSCSWSDPNEIQPRPSWRSAFSATNTFRSLCMRAKARSSVTISSRKLATLFCSLNTILKDLSEFLDLKRKVRDITLVRVFRQTCEDVRLLRIRRGKILERCSQRVSLGQDLLAKQL